MSRTGCHPCCEKRIGGDDAVAPAHDRAVHGHPGVPVLKVLDPIEIQIQALHHERNAVGIKHQIIAVIDHGNLAHLRSNHQLLDRGRIQGAADDQRVGAVNEAVHLAEVFAVEPRGGDAALRPGGKRLNHVEHTVAERIRVWLVVVVRNAAATRRQRSKALVECRSREPLECDRRANSGLKHS